MDSEDLKLLNDIVLIDQKLQISPCNSTASSAKTFGDELKVPSAVEAGPSTRTEDARTPKELNHSCQKALRDLEKKLVLTLEENLLKQRTIMDYLRETNKKREAAEDSNICKLIRCAGIFYFKDISGFPQPRNEDVKEKLSFGELLCADYLTNSCSWTKHDQECLTKAVLNNSKDTVSKSDANNGVKEEPMSTDWSIDWLKISATDMNGKYSATECEAQWKLHLSPNLNKKKWSASEIEELNVLAKKFKYQDWDGIAEQLGTNRSGYQCCVQYQTKNSLNEGKWTAKEDAFLKELVDKFTINSQIPWTKISWFFQTRSRRQCQERYLQHLRKGLKRGQFSEAEDKIIIYGAKIFKDFGKLAKFLPGRSPTQIRSRYYYLIGTKLSNFTLEDDKLLLSLANEHSNNWLKISEHFPNFSKLQCRKRYATLCRQKTDGELHDFWKDIQAWKKSNNKNSGARKQKRKERKEKDECDFQNELINYHENCSEHYFGPRMRNPESEEQLNCIASNMRTTMGMLSVSCDLSEKTEIIESLKNNCDFDLYDVKLLKKLAEEDASGNTTFNDNYILHGMLIPPNRGTLTGYHTLTSSRARISMRTWEAEELPQPNPKQRQNRTNYETLSCSRAKALFKSRIKSLFFLPSLLSMIPTDDLSHEVFHRGKLKKPKKLSKKRVRKHAREMNAASREKRRKLAEEEATNDMDDGGDAQEPTAAQENIQTSDLECKEMEEAPSESNEKQKS